MVIPFILGRPPYVAALALGLLPSHLLAQTTPSAASSPLSPLAVVRPVPVSDALAEAPARAQATVLLLTRRVDSLRQAYGQQQRLYSDLGGKFTSFLAGQKLSHTTRFTLAKVNIHATADLLLVCHSRLSQLRALTQALRNANEQAALSSPTDRNPLGISLVDYVKQLVATKAVEKSKGRRLVELATQLSQNSLVTALPTVGPLVNAVGELLTSVRASSLSNDGFTPAQVRYLENGLRPTLAFFLALDAARANNQASLLNLDNELTVLQHQLGQLYQPYAQLAAYQEDISAYYIAPPGGQPVSNALDVANISRMSNYVTTALPSRFAALDQAFGRAANQTDILDPNGFLTPANNSAEGAMLLAAHLQDLADRLPVITNQYSAAIRAAIGQGQQDGLIRSERAAKVIADESRRAHEADETYQQARAAERFGEALRNVKPLFKLY